MSRVLDAIARLAAEHPLRTALTCRGRSFHYAALAREVEAVAEALGALLDGIAPERPIALALDNDPAWVLLDLALIRLGRPCVPLPPFFTLAQSDHALADCGAAVLITDRENAAGAVLLAAGKPMRLQALDLTPIVLPAGTAKITYTSGSTGAPKGVCLSLAQMEQVAASLVEVIGEDHAGVHACVLPLAVLLENVAGVYPTLLAGGAVAVEPLAALGFTDPFRPDFPRLATALAEAHASSVILVPELLRGLIGALHGSGLSLGELRLVAVGGAKVAPALLAMARGVGLPVVEGYGLSECASVVALNTPGLQKPGTVGRPLPHLEVCIAPDGEILVGPEAFLGYVGQAPRSGFLHTGDLGELDADGFLKVNGRKSDTLITAFGRNVSPAWIEAELLARPEIGQALVFGEGEPQLAALIVPSAAEVDQAAVDRAVAAVNAALPDYARIGAVHLTSPFTPANGLLTGNGRPRRAAILAARRPVSQPLSPEALRITA